MCSEYFTTVIRIVTSNSGDIIKFCGDALIIMWPFDPSVDDSNKQAGAVFACLCALQLLAECDSSEQGNGIYALYLLSLLTLFLYLFVIIDMC